MIDEARTLELYGYTSDELKPQSSKFVVAVCEGCGRYRVVRKRIYRILCHSCSTAKGQRKRVSPSKETRYKISEAKTNPSEETRCKMREAWKNRFPITEETRHKLSEAQRKRAPPTEETKRKRSASLQGIELKDWKGYATEKPYCEKFDNECRKRNREKYGNQCFICGKTKEENSNRALSVHHVTKNKMEGCDGSKWRLIPMCMSCHSKSHTELMLSRLKYLLGGV